VKFTVPYWPTEEEHPLQEIDEQQEGQAVPPAATAAFRFISYLIKS